MARKKETAVDLCDKAVVLGNSIAIRMLEYLSTVKHQVQGIRELAMVFLDVGRILWVIESGMKASKADNKHMLPADLTTELEKRFRQTNDEFIVLNQLVTRFLENDKKSGFARFSKGFKMMFADSDVNKVRASLERSRESLRMSSLVFKWSIGEEDVDATIGIGYTGLAAALDRMNGIGNKPRTVAPSSRGAADDEQQPPRQTTPQAPLPELPRPSGERTLVQGAQPVYGHGGDSVRDVQPPQRKPQHDTLLEDLLSETDLNDHQQQQHDDILGDVGHVTRLKADPSTVPRWTPRFTTGNGNPQYKAALVQAVQKKSHTAIEQLLDRGVQPDSVAEINLLREAVLLRDLETVRLLLLFGADANAIDKVGCSPLFSATELGFLDAAKLLIKYGADPNMSAGPNADTPLALAVLENKFDLVQLFLMYGGNSNQIMANGNTTLIRSIDRNTPKRVIELILNYGGDPNIKNGEGTSPLFQCVNVQRLDIAHLLLDRGADPNLPGPKHLLWPSTYYPPFLRLLLSRGADHKNAPGIMELATSVNNIESVRILLNAGVDPNAKKDGVYTPLCSAIRDNRADIVTLLLANGADPNTPASEYPCFKCVSHHRAHFLPQLIEAGADPTEPKGIVEKAVQHNNLDALIFLLDHGVGVNVKSREGWTPLTTAIRDNRPEMVDLLLARGADPAIRGQDWPINLAVKRPNILKKLLPSIANPKNFKGVVEMAVCADQLESIRLLLSAGFNVEDKNGGVFSPLTSAIREGNKEITRYLIDEAGADVNAPGEHLPIIKAIRRMRNNDTELLELLLERGADINLMYRGWNAVLQAVENGDANVLRLLVEKGNGVDLEKTDENGQTVLDVVNGHGWDEAVQIINKSGRR
ncbi:ankyrin [Cryphonectria parasitica EP155]|uniref:Ankyrin n=1 Tax=Cryphonectria parasitica (strain ATCC 38755 / EP155) TaxID=660469 RepID=A0A9P5CKX2_CRYP1|nr:ankyrin [Cryphonectria parasitica EP155]KAF3761612.1 ankyrin [Cryphonectria parasitica EP155]